jgi:hypothetical protein
MRKILDRHWRRRIYASVGYQHCVRMGVFMKYLPNLSSNLCSRCPSRCRSRPCLRLLSAVSSCRCRGCVMFVGCDHLGGWGRRKLGSERGCGVNCARVDRHMRGTSHLHPRCFSAPKAGANRLRRRSFTRQLKLAPMRLPAF